MTGLSVSSEEMIRNRIDPVGSALGFLADLWGPELKMRLQVNPMEFTFQGYLCKKLGLQPDCWDEQLALAKRKYCFSDVLAAIKEQVRKYEANFTSDLAGFNVQSGTRVEIRFGYKSLGRSRNSVAKNWVMEQGKISLCSRVNLYMLKNDLLLFELSDFGLLEDNDWDRKIKQIVFFSAGTVSLRMDGAAVTAGEEAPIAFRQVDLQG